TLSYIRHRLAIAGFRGKNMFTAQSVDYLHHVSGGIPRLINIIAHKALIAAYGEGEQTVRPKHLRQASRDTIKTQNMKTSFFDVWLPAYSRWAFGLAGVIALI